MVSTARKMDADLSSRIVGEGPLWEIEGDVFCLQLSIVNVFFVGARQAGDRQWVLIDTGLPTSGSSIRRTAAELYGRGSRPAAILLTHGHFDHRGAARELAEEWDVPIYAHRLELPYLTGASDYPPPDPTVGGGLMAWAAMLYPSRAIDLRPRIQAFPNDGTLPQMPGWRGIHTPGHTPGHISLFRESDGVLIAGDAFVTVKQESALAVLTQTQEMHGPPAYFTPDWTSAGTSVRELAALRPNVAGTGHGQPMSGEFLRRELDRLAANFGDLAVPKHGRYVSTPALADERGVISVPPPVNDPFPLLLAGIGAVALVGLLAASRRQSPQAITTPHTHHRKG